MKSLTTKQRQYLLAAIAGFVGILSFTYIISSIFPSEDFKVEDSEDYTKETNITSAGRRVSPQELWVDRTDNEMKRLRQKVDVMQKAVLESSQIVQAREAEITELREKIEHLDARPSVQNANHLPNPAGVSQDFPQQSLHSASEHSPSENSESRDSQSHQPRIRKVMFHLKQHAPNKKSLKKTVENTIPAGAYAKAVFLGGVDASTSVSSSSDPRPVLLRLVDHGNLPRRFKSDLKACHLLASSYGDLSSERVYMRLEKLTCTEPLTGEIIETEVAGYIAGEDGRAGVRGVVADKAGDALRNTFIAGFVSSMGKFFGAQQQRSVYPVSPFGQTKAMPVDKMLGSGAAQGLSGAMDKFADFYIKRAEQLQPVIQVAAGRQVDIIFTQGTEFGDTSVKKTIHKMREKSRREAVTNLEDQGDTKTWLPEYEGDTK